MWSRLGEGMAAAGTDPLSGAHLGKEYWVVDRIGDGGMGVVYLVEHRGLKKQFAAKILNRELTENTEARARFEIEARSASQLDHENIVNVTDYGIASDGRPFLVMELLRGRTLYSRLTEGPLSLAETVAVIVPVCNALAAAHEAGIVHRDIKPENVFLVQRPGGRFHVKVLDFGIAKATMDTPRVTKLGQVLGSPLYMAPEACKGEDVDARADIYSLGVLLYQLTTGHLPFEDTNMLRLLQLHTSKPVPSPRKLNPDISEEIEAVVLRALEKDREVRFQSVEELAHALLEALPPGADALLRAPVMAPPPTRTPLPGTTGGLTRTPTPQRTPMSSGTPLGSVTVVPQGTSSVNVPSSSTVSVASGGMKLGAAAQHAMLEGGPTLMAAPSSPSVLAMPVPGTVRPEETISTRAARPRRGLVLIVSCALAAAGIVLALVWSKSRPAAVRTAVPPAQPSSTMPTMTPTQAPTSTPTQTPVATPRVHIRVTSTPPGAQVRLAGKELGSTPLDVEIDAASGSAPLELRDQGRWRTLREVALDHDVELDVSLESPKDHRPTRPVATPRPKPSHPNPTTPTPPPQDLEIRGRR